MPKLTLYDLPSKGRCACWSPNPWKTRLALNFKAIDYQTEWIEYPDIEPKFSPYVPSNPPDTPAAYTIPTVKFSDGSYLMDSKKIALKLEQENPTPTLYIDSPILVQVEGLIPKIMDKLRGVWMPRIPINLLNEPSKEFFERTREERYGKPLPQFAEETGGESAWVNAGPFLKELAEIVKANGGPFVMGESPSYADFVIVALFQSFKTIEEGVFTRIVGDEPAFEKLYEASRKWLERDDH